MKKKRERVCGNCLFYIFRCKNHQALVRAAEEYTRFRYHWTRKHEELYEKLTDDDGVCLIQCIIVASDHPACRNYVEYTKYTIKFEQQKQKTKIPI